MNLKLLIGHLAVKLPVPPLNKEVPCSREFTSENR